MVKRERSVNVAIVGNCYYDEIWRVFEHPRSGEKSNTDFIQKGLGGSATNTAIALRRVEYQAHLFSMLERTIYCIFSSSSKYLGND